MDGVGERIRQRARALGLSDSELARRIGVDASRLGKYTRDVHEPDLTTLLRICETLALTPNDLLLPEATEGSTEREKLLSLIGGLCAGLPEEQLKLLVRMIGGLGKPSID